MFPPDVVGLAGAEELEGAPPVPDGDLVVPETGAVALGTRLSNEGANVTTGVRDAGVETGDGNGTSLIDGFLLALGSIGRGALVCPEGDLVALAGFCAKAVGRLVVSGSDVDAPGERVMDDALGFLETLGKLGDKMAGDRLIVG